MKYLMLVATALLSFSLYAQEPAPYASVDALALKLPDASSASVDGIAAYVNAHFPGATEKTRAIFIWIGANIQFDVANMSALDFYGDTAEYITQALKTRKGIGTNYAWLFSAICNRVGIQSLVVDGYIKQRGFVGFIPHAWSAVVIEGKWYLFDPTWGSGYVENNVFVRELNETYFKATPAAFITTHMPFDPLWEFLYYPVTADDFFNGKTGIDKSRPYFNYPDSMKAYWALPRIGQETAAADRIERNGVPNSSTADMIRHLRTDVTNYQGQQETDRQNRVVDSFNTASKTFNQSINLFNVFINYRNDEFKPMKPDAEIQQMMDTAQRQLWNAKGEVAAIVLSPADSRIQSSLQQLKDAIAQAEPHFREAQEWLLKYFSKGKLGRKGMFYKFSWL